MTTCLQHIWRNKALALTLAGVGLAFFATTGQARTPRNRAPTGSKPQGDSLIAAVSAKPGQANYGMAGCGVGSMVFKKDTVGSQLGATCVQDYGPYLMYSAGYASTSTGVASAFGSGSATAGGGSVSSSYLGTTLVYAGITMAVVFMPSWAMTTQISNCNPSNVKQVSAAEQRLYVSTNLPALSKDAARGEGEHLDTLATLAGCNEPMARIRYAQEVHSEFNELFASDDPETIAEALVDVVGNSEDLSATCTVTY